MFCRVATWPKSHPPKSAGLSKLRSNCDTVNTPASKNRIRQAKATGLCNLPFNAFDPNAARLEIILAATDLITWIKLTGFTDHPGLALCEIATFRYRILHTAARITGGARQTRLTHRRHLALGQTPPPPGSESARPSDKPAIPPQRDERPLAFKEPAHRSDTGRPATPTRQNHHHQPARTGLNSVNHAARKMEVSPTIKNLLDLRSHLHASTYNPPLRDVLPIPERPHRYLVYNPLQ